MIAEPRTVIDAISAKVQKLRPKYEKDGYEVIERPGPEEFPFDVGPFAGHRPAMLAKRGDERHVFEVREAVASTGRLADRAGKFRDDPNWQFYLMSCDDVVPDDAPGIQGEPRSWPRLEHTADETLHRIRTLPSWLQLLALWTALEGVLQRIAVDHGIPVDLLSASTLIPVLRDRGLIPKSSYEPLMDAHETHRVVRHGFGVPDEQVAEAVRTLSEWLMRLLPQPVERAA